MSKIRQKMSLSVKKKYQNQSKNILKVLLLAEKKTVSYLQNPAADLTPTGHEVSQVMNYE